MRNLNHIFIAFFCSLIFSQVVNAAVINEVNENGPCINQIIRTSHYWGRSFIEYFLSGATQNDIKNIKLCGNKELIKYIEDFFEDYKDRYGKKGSIQTILAWKWFVTKQPIGFEGNKSFNSIAISHDDMFMVTSSNKTQIWDRKSGKLIKTFLEEDTYQINSVAISYDNTFIVAGSYDYTAKIWDIETGELIRTLEGHSGPITSVAISHDDRFVVTGSDDKIAKIWDIKTGKLIQMIKNDYSIKSVAISNDDTFIVTGSYDKTHIWDIKTWRLIKTLDGHTDWIRSVAISSDDTFIVTGSDDETAKIWDVATGILIHTLQAGYRYRGWIYSVISHLGPIYSVAISQDDRFIVTGADDKIAKIWNVATGELIKTLNGHTNSIYSVAISQDDTFIVTASIDGTAKVWSFKYF